jgi:hypothetical protein
LEKTVPRCKHTKKEKNALGRLSCLKRNIVSSKGKKKKKKISNSTQMSERKNIRASYRNTDWQGYATKSFRGSPGEGEEMVTVVVPMEYILLLRPDGTVRITGKITPTGSTGALTSSDEYRDVAQRLNIGLQQIAEGNRDLYSPDSKHRCSYSRYGSLRDEGTADLGALMKLAKRR